MYFRADAAAPTPPTRRRRHRRRRRRATAVHLTRVFQDYYILFRRMMYLPINVYGNKLELAKSLDIIYITRHEDSFELFCPRLPEKISEACYYS